MFFLLWSNILGIGFQLLPGQNRCIGQHFDSNQPFDIEVFYQLDKKIEKKDQVFDIQIFDRDGSVIKNQNKVPEFRFWGYVQDQGIYRFCVTNPTPLVHILHFEINKGMALHNHDSLPSLTENQRVSQMLTEVANMIEDSARWMNWNDMYYEVSEETIRGTNSKVYVVGIIILAMIALLNYVQFKTLKNLLTERKLI